MEEKLYSQPFYNKINNDTKKMILNLFNAHKKKKLMNRISIYIYIIIGIVFLICFKSIMFQKIYLSNINTTFELCKYLVIIGGLLSVSSLITKKSSSEYDKCLKKIKAYLLLDICNCENKCCCKNEMIKFLSTLGFYLI